MKLCVPRRGLWALFAFLLVVFCLGGPQAQEEEKTYSISLTKTAGVEKEIYTVEDRKVLTEEYTVQEGEWVWQILRERGLLEQRNLSEILAVLKKLNKSLGNLSLIHPGEKIIIPLKIAPVTGASIPSAPVQPIKTSLADLKDVDLENYTVRPGDTLSRVVRGRYDIPADYLYGEYLEMVKKLNPTIGDVDVIHPGQKIRLPIYSPEIVRKPIVAAKPQVPKEKKSDKQDLQEDQGKKAFGDDLGIIFAEMGEDWVQTGEHFIPLKSGGQIDLKAASFPILNLRDGLRVIVDVNNKLPETMATLIESSWGNYRVLHLLKDDDLRSAMDKILRVCDYKRLYKGSEPLELGGDILLSITGDWIITVSETGTEERPSFVVINLKEGPAPDTPRMIKAYLETLGVKLIDYPPDMNPKSQPIDEVETLEGGGDTVSLVRTLLDLTGQSYSNKVDIPVYQRNRADFKLAIKADFFLNIQGKDAIIDLTGLAPEVISLLDEHQFLVLSLAGEKDPLTMVSKTLGFIGVQSQDGPHSFMAADRSDSRNVKLTVSGIIFSDTHGNTIFATPLNLPNEIASFLSTRAYRILPLSSS